MTNCHFSIKIDLCYNHPMKATIQDILNANSNVRFGYLFGSYATGEATPNSDVDIAVYLENTSLDAQLSLHHALQKVLQKEVDLIILNTTHNIYLLESIIYHGILLKDHEMRPEYEVRKQHEIIDFKVFRKIIDAA